MNNTFKKVSEGGTGNSALLIQKYEKSKANYNENVDKVKKMLGRYQAKLGYLPKSSELLKTKEGRDFYNFCNQHFLGGYAEACREATYAKISEERNYEEERKEKNKKNIEKVKSVLGEYYERLGHLPEKSELDMTKEGKSFYSFCGRNFIGGYETACREAGYGEQIEEAKRKKSEAVMQKVKSVLGEYYERLGHLPEKSELDMTKEGKSFYSFCGRHFIGGYETACCEAGYGEQIEEARRKKSETLMQQLKQKLKQGLSEYYEKFGRLPGYKEIKETKEGQSFYRFCQTHFGGYDNACTAAGYYVEKKEKDSKPPPEPIDRPKAKKEKLIRVMGEYYERLGYLPGKTELYKTQEGKWFYMFCHRHFEGFENACKVAGYNVEECLDKYIKRNKRKAIEAEKQQGRKEIGKGLIELYGRLGHTITEADLPATGLLSITNICMYFKKGLNSALLNNGLHRHNSSSVYSKEEIINEMRRVYAEHGEISTTAMNRYGKMSSHPVLRAFGSFENGLKAADLEKAKRGRRLKYNKKET